MRQVKYYLRLKTGRKFKLVIINRPIEVFIIVMFSDLIGKNDCQSPLGESFATKGSRPIPPPSSKVLACFNQIMLALKEGVVALILFWYMGTSTSPSGDILR